MKGDNTSAREPSARRLRLRRVMLSSAFVVACAAAAFAQAEAPVVVVESVLFPNYPVELVAMDVAGKAHAFAPGRPGQFLASFETGEDWLRQFAFRIRNKSDKAITHVTLRAAVGTGEEGDIPLGIDALYGRELDESAYTWRAPRGEPRRLAPGATDEVRLAADEYEKIVSFAATKKQTPADFRKVRLDLNEVYFEDGTVWAMGRSYRIDPNDSRKWTALDGRPLTGAPSLRELRPGERVVEVDPRKSALKDEPGVLAVTEIRVNGQTVAPGQPFAASAGWMRTLTLRVKNLSAKPITFVQINLSLPEASYHAGGLGFVLHYREARLDGQNPPGAKPLPPGEEADLSFREGDYEHHWKFVTGRSGLTEFSHVRLGYASVNFADGTRASVVSLLPKPAAAGGVK